ncbi:MAG: SpoIIE family protein phosphatase [Solirubrobacterales bacterium]|nr:SpoIIE family protein phosphatase [Solirubrobacterales bacterium]
MDRPPLTPSRGQVGRILDVLAEAVTVTEADGRLVFANAAALERMGIKTLEEARASGPAGLLARFEITDEEGRPVDPDKLPGRALLRGEPAEPMLLRLVHKATGRVFWTLVKASEFEDDQGRRLAVNVLEDVTAVRERQLRERFLSHASDVLASSLEYEETLTRVAELAVPHLADWCSVEMLEGKRINQLAVAHVDPAMVAFARQLQQRFRPSLDDATGVGAVMRTGKGEFYPNIPDELLVANARDEEQLQVMRELEMRSVMIVPMRSRASEVLGAITFVAAGAPRRFSEADFAFVKEFAARAGSAVENARLYRERSETAAILRHSLLPARLPTAAEWRTATLYRPAAPEREIGGDFFDLFVTEGGFTVVIGDVTGKGIEAAALTAMIRHSLRASSLLGLSPAASLALLNRLLAEQAEFSLATATVAKLTIGANDAVMTVASAGHPLPLRLRRGASPVEAGTSGILLGFDPGGAWPESTVTVGAGDTLFFYTDGVTDTPGRHGRFGENRLRRLLDGSPQEPEDLLQVVDCAVREFGDGESLDDVAMLAVQLLPGAAPASAAPTEAQPVVQSGVLK